MSASRRLKVARVQRGKIASTLKLLGVGQISLTDTLRDPKPHLNRVSIWTLLTHSHKIGEAGANKILREAKVWPTTRIGQLSEKEREAIIGHLPPRARDATM